MVGWARQLDGEVYFYKFALTLPNKERAMEVRALACLGVPWGVVAETDLIIIYLAHAHSPPPAFSLQYCAAWGEDISLFHPVQEWDRARYRARRQ